MHWRRLNGEPLSGNLPDEVEMAISHEQAAGNSLTVCIGTDSQVKGTIVEFATAVVFVREKCGGFMFVKNERIKNTFGIKERMLTEVYKSIEITYQLSGVLAKFGIIPEVHADINTNPGYKSNAALHEAMGYILSMGYAFKAKPDAFASSYCANKVVQ